MCRILHTVLYTMVGILLTKIVKQGSYPISLRLRETHSTGSRNFCCGCGLPARGGESRCILHINMNDTNQRLEYIDSSFRSFRSSQFISICARSYTTYKQGSVPAPVRLSSCCLQFPCGKGCASGGIGGAPWPRAGMSCDMRPLALLLALVCPWSVEGETTIELNGSNAYVDIAELVRR